MTLIRDITTENTAPAATDELEIDVGSGSSQRVQAGKIAGTAFTAKGDALFGSAAETAAAVTVGADGEILVADASEPSGVKWEYPYLPYDEIVVCSDETTAIATIGQVATLRAPAAVALTQVRASLNQATVTGTFTVDIKANEVSILSTLITIDAGDDTSTKAAVPPVISTSNITDDERLSVEITNVGDGTATGCKVTLSGVYAAALP